MSTMEITNDSLFRGVPLRLTSIVDSGKKICSGHPVIGIWWTKLDHGSPFFFGVMLEPSWKPTNAFRIGIEYEVVF